MKKMMKMVTNELILQTARTKSNVASKNLKELTNKKEYLIFGILARENVLQMKKNGSLEVKMEKELSLQLSGMLALQKTKIKMLGFRGLNGIYSGPREHSPNRSEMSKILRAIASIKWWASA